MRESNKKKGSDFESEWVEYLSKQGYWAHKLAPSDNGSQPFDVIAVNGNKFIGYECKTCATKRFDLKRVEDNQYYAISKALKSGIDVRFVFKLDSGSAWELKAGIILDFINSGIKSFKVNERCVKIENYNR